jgi:hypothetical protein
MKEYVNDIQMVAIAGPRMDVKSLSLVDGVQVYGYVPDLYMYFAAADVVITQGVVVLLLKLQLFISLLSIFLLRGILNKRFMLQVDWNDMV